jgi:hypothetical protein
MSRRPARIAPIVFGSILAISISLGYAAPVAACSCVQPQPMAAYRGDPSQTIFTGIVQPPDAKGVPVTVTRWFQGQGGAAIVWLDAGSFGADGASCGTPLPPAGSEWIFVSYRTETGGLGVNLCTPHAPASAAEGQALFADAVATFGEGQVMTPASEPPATTPSVTPAASGGFPLPLPILAAGGVAILAGIAALAFMLARGRRDRGRPADPL